MTAVILLIPALGSLTLLLKFANRTLFKYQSALVSPFIERARYFNNKTPKLKKYSQEELQDIANDILNEQA